ncbi:short-chain dehydrogenase/reductase SDR [Rippkaea orientalis PCC 8801]|uniref:Short-chain dehydrogenase/reductase SDR n=1 Tax=Rippkaea orientalis (strain PCC 8801 / RF-1) TaxID=41431 RepID=B7JZJ9_RIPO1|nr:SDR family oxidoreductase [Rippkaea orientalis]ACK64159.1 short-chain dehydrogenase/reductase SDR [Rippkaea orientalis PCC 8801]
MKPVVIITGVAGGIGYATAQYFASQGWSVIGVDCQEITQLMDIDHYVKADLCDADQIDAITEKLDRLDGLVNNAAVQICKPIIEMDVTEWDQVMAVNLRSAFLLSKAAYPLLKVSQGSVVNVSSVHAIATSGNIAAYAASKGGLAAFSRALAIEWANDQIRVNAILPGAVDTPMLHAGLTRGHLSGNNVNELMNQLAAKTVIGRVGKPDEIAKGIFFLANKELSSFITGQTLVIDGGATIRLSTE